MLFFVRSVSRVDHVTYQDFMELLCPAEDQDENWELLQDVEQAQPPQVKRQLSRIQPKGGNELTELAQRQDKEEEEIEKEFNRQIKQLEIEREVPRSRTCGATGCCLSTLPRLSRCLPLSTYASKLVRIVLLHSILSHCFLPLLLTASPLPRCTLFPSSPPSPLLGPRRILTLRQARERDSALGSDFGWLRTTRKPGKPSFLITRHSCFYDCTRGTEGQAMGLPIGLDSRGKVKFARQGEARVLCLKLPSAAFLVARVPFTKNGGELATHTEPAHRCHPSCRRGSSARTTLRCRR